MPFQNLISSTYRSYTFIKNITQYISNVCSFNDDYKAILRFMILIITYEK